MKKIYIALLISVLATSLVSCERSFLEPWPPDAARSMEDIWGNYKYSKGVLDDIYKDNIMCPYINDVTCGSGYGMLASACDEAEHSLSTSGVQRFTNGVWNPTSTLTILYGGPWAASRNSRSPWINSYIGIRKANIFLENVDHSALINDLNDPTRRYERTWFKGQAYFWRAYLSFVILRNFGPFVISTSKEYIGEDLFRPRNTMDECVAQILDDCNKAIDSLPAIWDDANWGRVNAAGAAALKSRLLLYYASPLYQGEFRNFGLAKGEVGEVKRWVDAADAAREAINNNEFYDITPVTNYTRPYSSSGRYSYVVANATKTANHEIIFHTTWTTTYSAANEYYNLPAGVDGCYGYTNPTQDMVDQFEVVTGTGANRKAVPFDWNNPEHAKDPYANRDTRFYNSILYNGALWGTTSSKAYNIDTYEGGVHRDRTLKNCTKTGYYFRKYLSEGFYAYVSGSYSTATHCRFEFRFAELVLNYAEALNEAYGPETPDPNGELRPLCDGASVGVNTAKAAVDAIRARVNMPPLADGLSQAEMREAIHHERNIELCFEGHRFYDARRWKEGEKLGAPIHGIVITATGFNAKGRPTGFTYEVEEVEKRVWKDCYYWWPIPYSECVKYNGVLEQNPGW